MNQQSGVRFALKKRTIRNSLDDVNISSYNSDFLSGLFADVAKVTEMTSSGGKRSLPFPDVSNSKCSLTTQESPTKKPRTLLRPSMSRCKYSSYHLSQLDSSGSSKAVIELSNDVIASTPTEVVSLEEETRWTTTQSIREHSLAFQLDCVSGTEASKVSPETAVVVAFPNLPATVSDSSCTAGLTRGSQIMHGSSPEKQHKESFGWFVDLDDQNNEGQIISSYSASCSDLAFQAPTAPRASHNDAEVQWAKAADTVDDVLGDFF